jgi:hypothetical protein
MIVGERACDRHGAAQQLAWVRDRSRRHGVVESDVRIRRRDLLAAPAARFDAGTRLEVYSGDSTVVIFGTDPAQVDRAAAVLIKEPPAGAILTSTLGALPPLPAPLPGAIDGTLPCMS